MIPEWTYCEQHDDDVIAETLKKKWKQDVLSDVQKMAMSSEMEEIIPPTPLIVVSNGGHIDCVGTYGWIISTQDQILWKGKGMARGIHMDSFKAENTGCLSVMSFLQEYGRFRQIEWNTARIRYYCDNKGVIQKIHNYRSCKKFKTSYYSDPEYDSLSETAVIIKDMEYQGAELQCCHIKSHQDKNRKIEDLSRKEFLNTMADQLATEQPDDTAVFSVPTAKIPIDSCDANLIYQGQIVTSHEESILRTEVASLDLQIYIMKRNKWTLKKWNNLDWVAFQTARKASGPIQKRFVTKLAHG